MEQSLREISGVSDEVASKNRVRRVITEFFNERDCFAMVRPLAEESALKNLDKTQIENLRPEFVDQVFALREKIFSKCKVKKVHGVEVDGQALGHLLLSYSKAINEGAVPNIEQAWNYVCLKQS